MDLISVVIPIYKVEDYLDRCVESVLNQTYKNLEIILVDDGSPDKCPEICDRWSEKDNRIKVIHKQNGGLSSARNAGIDIAKGDYITFIDSDDLIHPQMVQILYDALKKCNTEISACTFERNNGVIPHIDTDNVDVKKLDTEEYYINRPNGSSIAWSKLYKRTLFENIRYPEGKLHEDEFTTYKVLFALPYIAFVNMKLYIYFENEESITKTKWKVQRLDAFEALEEQAAYFKTNNYIKAYKNTLNMYIYITRRQYDLLLATYAVNSKYAKDMRKRMRKAISKYKKELGITISKYAWAYETAYPNMMKVYWKLKNIIK